MSIAPFKFELRSSCAAGCMPRSISASGPPTVAQYSDGDQQKATPESVSVGGGSNYLPTDSSQPLPPPLPLASSPSGSSVRKQDQDALKQHISQIQRIAALANSQGALSNPATPFGSVQLSMSNSDSKEKPLSMMISPQNAGPSVSMSSAGPPPLVRASSLQMPSLVRSTSMGTKANSQAAPAAPEWRSFVAIEERTAVRGKLHQAYAKNAPTYEELLELATAIDEELIFSSSTTRLDYFKAAIDWDNRLAVKNKQLSGHIGVNGLSGPGRKADKRKDPEDEKSTTDEEPTKRRK